ncbi:MAG: DNA repair protein RecN [Pigmentiphaga sp.]|nr:DNA repair protein RecN [Pigmentiphaga sp.]
MLRALHIRDFVIVAETEVEFGPGFTVFSGETGAGKSILIDALALSLGERADASVVREGAQRAEVSALFDVPEPVQQWLLERDLDNTGGLLLRRVIDAQGRSKAYINGTPSTLAQLRELGEQLVDIHGQHAHQSLLRADAQRELLDAHAQAEADVQQVQACWKHWRDVAHRLELVERDAARLNDERDRLQWEADLLDELALQPNEWDALQTEHQRLSHAQSLIEGANQTLALLDEQPESVYQLLSSSCQRIHQLVQHDPALHDVEASLDSARIALQEAISDLNSYLSRVEPDPQRLEQLESRLAEVIATARKLRSSPEALLDYRDALQSQLDTLKEAQDLAALQRAVEQAEASYQHAAQALRKRRQQAARSLSKQVTTAMQTLAMPGGKFEVSLRNSPPHAHGLDHIEFRVAGHAGAQARALAKVASGGELARISLALSVIASQAARVPTLIFDEVDTGIGGAVAEVVGRLLRELGARHQVLCVTHLPQVAACGNIHYRVDKRSDPDRTHSAVIRMDKNQRVDEIARMLGGIDITATTRKHAREMLNKH